MSARKLILFKHDTQLGNAPSHKLFDLLEVKSATGGDKPARSFSDYEITIDSANVPSGVTLEEKI
jgi:CRISPR-associated protein Csd2